MNDPDSGSKFGTNSHESAFVLAMPNRGDLAVFSCVKSSLAQKVEERQVRTAENAAVPVSFNKDIRPIFTASCTACHGGVKQAGDVSFVYESSIHNVLRPGDPAGSLIVEKITDPDEDTRMPPKEHGPRLSAKEIELIERWIAQGAKYEKHWSYQAPHAYPPPSVSDPNWSRQPIDTFVLQQLDERKIKPAPAEIPERWLRRVTLDLIGLPPTLQERADFFQDLTERGEKAYAAVVDRLLGSERLGERWASVWFDQVRYADSRGMGFDNKRNIWKYRDWVIDAINRDLPYDQFTIKQIAGDLLPDALMDDKIATAVHRLTQSNEEGGTNDEEFRVAAVLDRVNTVWQTWQGTTFGCVQCHNHPYDPFTHEEYYRFSAFFNNTRDCDLDDDWPHLRVPLNLSDYTAASDIDRKAHALTEWIWQKTYDIAGRDEIWQPLRIDSVACNKETQVVVEKKDKWDEYHTVDKVARQSDMTVECPMPAEMKRVTGIQITALPLDPEKAYADAELGFVMTRIQVELLAPGADKPTPVPIEVIFGDDPFPQYDPNDSIAARPRATGFAAFTQFNHPRTAALVLKSPLENVAGSKLRITLQHGVFHQSSFSMVTRRARFAVTDSEELARLPGDAALAAARKELADTERRRPTSTNLPVMSELPRHLARPTFVFTRGLFLTKDKQVTTGVPASLNDSGKNVSNRLQLAEWLVSPANPLTARVQANRVWARLFGVGLVATEEDFGSTGDEPSHPELFDDLAFRFRTEYGWSVKKLLRELVLSSTYRQSSKIRPELEEADASNRWLARGPRFSLPAETVRDQTLAISGLLSPKMFGPPVYPPLPEGVWKPFSATDRWATAPVGNEDRYRRTLYTYTKRSIPFPMQSTFDAPTREFCAPKRLRSNTPLQPLMMLNDEGMAECAQAFAIKIQATEGELAAKLRNGFMAATCREPGPQELQALEQLYQRVAAQGSPEIAMMSVAGVLLNLDEVVTN